MPINPAIFREYDIRGNAAADMGDASLPAIAGGIARWFQQKGANSVVLAYDCRLSSPRIHEGLRQVFQAYGFDVVSIGHSSTPCFYNACFNLDVAAGVMITASHNPAPDNGLKLMLGKDTLFGSQIQEIGKEAAQIFAEGAPLPSGQGSYREIDHLPFYIQDLVQRIQLGERPLKVIIDCGNGSSGPSVQGVLDCYPGHITYTPLNFTPDGTFPVHEADPVKPKNMVDLQRLVISEKADLGVGFDGDGDRLGIIDDQAQILWGDQLMILFWRDIITRHPGAIGLVEVKCSQLLFDEIARLGGKPEFCRTGHSLIKARMKEVNALFAGEMSGHLFFADEYYVYDDALYSFLRLLRLLSHTDQPLSVLLGDLPHTYNTPEVRIPCPDAQKFQLVQQLSEALQKEYPVVTVDGVRVIFPEGWGLFRASNTQAAIVARCEATSSAKLEEYTAYLNRLYLSFTGGEPIHWA
ncbi:MAG: phosphomannomutase/phosphoglucomutase [Symbiobacteriaceae bacterium]|nr:phosphomannomutase/phosphoglucomutase [Symbiobacteriaceae bacterium]